ncbi:DciA family protein [Taylorella equigenitalis]|uniref:DciA family protein n=1 Tax=Taylorella equigenitalis TaxID=29575 RepID=UPI00237CBFD9|nr:DciA family protein [Taylorella equigenitalis]WDU53085.1 DUF721 domain-containing protein [Taylorella equigenitalis]WEE00131.1 DciA family protein [Taylorella equigenitalis]WEE01608.1 DciA family protein [Taylorella equigenitalis]WFD78145.1 DciA family protein [Taylorella equigenitalis]WFD79623.1 DciA family protein [Taylorella equigenitalis]
MIPSRKKRSQRVYGFRNAGDKTLRQENLVLAHAMRNINVESDIYQLVTEDFIEKCRVVQLIDEELVILASNNAIHSKLKQVTPSIVRGLRAKGYRINRVVGKVSKSG